MIRISRRALLVGVTVFLVADLFLVALLLRGDATPLPFEHELRPPAGRRRLGEESLLVDVTTVEARPVADAVVSLLPHSPSRADGAGASNPWAPWTEPETPIDVARTDTAGRASFTGLATARYRVAVRAAGLAVAVAHVGVARGVPASPLRLALQPRCTLSGVVRKWEGGSAPGVMVIAAPSVRSTGNIDPSLHFRAKTDALGAFSFDAMPPGRYGVWARRAGDRCVEIGAATLPDTTPLDLVVTEGGLARGRVLDAESGEPLAGARLRFSASAFATNTSDLGDATTDADGVYEWRTGAVRVDVRSVDVSCDGHASVSVDDPFSLTVRETRERDYSLAREAVVTGRVYGPAGPLAGAWVGARATETLRDDVLIAGTRTEVDGSFRLGGLPEGRLVLTSSATGLIPGRVSVETRRGEAATREIVMATDTDAAPTTVRFGGRVLLPDGKPAAGALVWTASYSKWHLPDRTDTVAASDGTFSISAEGTREDIAVNAQAHGCAVGGGRPETLTGISIQLKPLPSVRGTVRSALGAAVAGARVFVGEKTTFKGNSSVDWDRTPETTVRDDGTFEAFIEPYRGAGSSWSPSYRDEYVVAVLLDGHAPALAAPFPLPDAASPHVADFVLDAGTQLRGRVVLAATGAPVAGLALTVSTWTARRVQEGWPPVAPLGRSGTRSRTAADGTFVLPHLAPGRLRLVASPEGLVETAQEIDVPSSSPLEIRVPAWSHVTGAIVGPDGAPVAKALVRTAPLADGRQGPGTHTDTTGGFQLDRIPEGDHLLAVVPPDAEPDLSPLEGVPIHTGRKLAPIALAKGVALRGELLAADGTPIAGAEAWVRRAAIQEYGTKTVTDDDGRFVVHGCAAAPLQIEFHKLCIAFERVPAADPAHLRLPGVLTISGRMTTPDGGECDDGELEARRVDADPSSPVAVHRFGRFLRDGQFRFEHLAAGRYEIISTSPLASWRAGERFHWRVPPGTVVEAGASDVTIVAVPAVNR